MKTSRKILALLFTVATVSLAVTANAEDNKAVILNQTTISLVQSSCDAAMQKDSVSTSAGGYISDNNKLHQCQYFLELRASGCLKSKTCQSYAQWSKANPEISPKLPRGVFIERLDKREQEVRAVLAARAN